MAMAAAAATATRSTWASKKPSCFTMSLRSDLGLSSDLARRDALIEENLDWARQLAASIARRLPTWFTEDDLVGPAEEALVRLAAQYDPALEVPFRAFASPRIRFRCIDSIRRQEYIERATPQLSALQDEKELDIPDPAPWPDHLSDRALQERTVCKHVEALPLPHWRVVHLHYREGLTMEEIGPRMHLSVSRISQIRKEAIGMLRASVEATPERETEPRKCTPIRPPFRPAA